MALIWVSALLTFSLGFLIISESFSDRSSPKDKGQEKGDEVLRRLLMTPPDRRKSVPAK